MNRVTQLVSNQDRLDKDAAILPQKDQSQTHNNNMSRFRDSSLDGAPLNYTLPAAGQEYAAVSTSTGSSAYDGSKPAPGTTDTNAWIPVDAPVKGDPSDRNADIYDQVINQFAVAVNPRYTPRNGNTYCNIFAWDVTRAMGAEIPHWIDGNGNSVGVGKGKELTANATNDWLNTYGNAQGWRKVSASEAQNLANQGYPAVVSWKNPGGIGHIGVVRPGTINDNGPALAQAGSHNFNNGHVYDSFPRNSAVQFWVNDRNAENTPVPEKPAPGGPTNPPVLPAQGVILKNGSQNQNVVLLQTALNQLGFNPGPIDGIFGPKTESVLKNFQASAGITVDGIYGNQTRQAMLDAQAGKSRVLASTLPAKGTLLKNGAQNQNVVLLQAALKKLGFDPGQVDGIFGPKTEKALKNFQTSAGIAVDGIYGNQTRQAMLAASVSKNKTGGIDVAKLGELSASYESNGDPGAVSSGVGDYGGVSYGTYQFATNTGSAKAFADWLNTAHPEYGAKLKGLTPGTQAFSNAWKAIAKSDPTGFGQVQHDYIADQFYVPAKNKVEGAVSGLDFDKRSKALNDVLWSTAVQHGPAGAQKVFVNALAGQDAGQMSDSKIINAIYAERGKRDANGNLAYFKSSSKDIQESVAQRFTNELKDALAMLADEK